MSDLTQQDEIEEPTKEVDLTCRMGQGCENEGITIRLTVPESTTVAYCGSCGAQITDVRVRETG